MADRDKARNEDKATEWPAFQKFRRAAEEAMLRCGLHTDSARLRSTNCFVMESLMPISIECPFRMGVTDSRRRNWLISKIGIAPSNYSRWRKGQIPRGDKFVLLAAALDARLPRGARAALLGFCKAFDGIQARLGKPSVPLTGSQALCLWAVFRTRAWWEAAQTGQARHFKIASRDVSDRMREYRPQTRIVPVTRIQAMIKDHCRLGAYWSWS